jgi:hypothetical protein
MPPEQVPSDSAPWEDWQSHKLDDKTSAFNYSDSTSEHIGGDESQKFHYGRDPLPEKM